VEEENYWYKIVADEGSFVPHGCKGVFPSSEKAAKALLKATTLSSRGTNGFFIFGYKTRQGAVYGDRKHALGEKGRVS